ncbi:MAG TPA: phosphoenolpyruvate--protein phosphotransferase [Chthoniobacteraceae bacterium]|jgi:phosphocarrier protein FPr|nr:phosphoenolpyruvate--protein phosphotransferase [Chthoniobacteraceae bacterium]
MSERVVVIAPLTGILVPLERVPDPVFSQKMVGEGVAIDPLDNLLRAPCDGTVAQIHPSGHAVTVVTAQGIQILMHVGLDTVGLQGRGFTPKVKPGDHVATGAPLVEFDMDFLATHARSLLTPVVIANSDRAESFAFRTGKVVAAKDAIFSLIPNLEREAAGSSRDRVVSHAILIPNPLGLHARPSAALANAAKRFQSEIQLLLGAKQANAKSITSIMALDVTGGAKVMLAATGPDAGEAVAVLAGLLTKGGTAPGAAPIIAPLAQSPPPEPNLLRGVTASPGIGAGNIFQVRHGEISIPETAADPAQERELLHAAIERAKGQLVTLQAECGGDPARVAILAAHAELAQDPALVEMAEAAIGKGKSAAFAWKSALEKSARILAEIPNAVLAQRANDLRDAGGRVLESLTGTERRKREYPMHAILIAGDLSPSDTAALDRTRIMGFCTTRGGPTSHVAILARSLGIPALAAVDPRALDVPNSTLAILDASTGVLRLKASLAEVNEVLETKKNMEAKYRKDLDEARYPAIMSGGGRVPVLANLGAAEDSPRVTAVGGDGVGLLRSEFLFMERTSPPTEEEQWNAYREIAQALGRERPLIIRTLDAGGDKPLPYLSLPPQEVPFLGDRGIRIGLAHPRMLRAQFRAILRAAEFGKIRVMLPMVAMLDELRDAKAMLADEAAKLGLAPTPLGIMVEVPAAALMTSQFAAEADFFSIGTNDLAQYTLAMDRTHAKLAPQVDALNPAVLRLVAMCVEGAHAHGKPVGVCGGAAADPFAVPILLGLGVDELSVSLPAIPGVKARVRTLEIAQCRALAQRALACDTAAAVRALTL